LSERDLCLPRHDPEKWEPVFHATNAKRLRADHAQAKILESSINSSAPVSLRRVRQAHIEHVVGLAQALPYEAYDDE
jgi:hypothetical protein